jgi:beta-glucosidase
LLAANISPFLTLYHWDLPQALDGKGGWTSRDVGYAFADYAALMVKRLGDRVRHWTTFNEPSVVAFDGYLAGEHAPGIQDYKAALQVNHNLLVAHGLAVQAMRGVDPSIQAGIVLNLWPSDPTSDLPEDAVAAEANWQQRETLFLDTLFRAHYPVAFMQNAGADMPDIRPGDMALMSQKLDFVGINYYSRNLVGAQGVIRPVPGSEYTEMGWEVHAPGLRRLLNRIHRDYRLPPIHITENGAAFQDAVSPDGKVHDPRRLEYLRQHFIQTRLAMQDGVDVRGYFVWSLLDNFEWGHGYTKRFGLVRVDFDTQERVIKDSGEWYSRVIAANAVE